MKHFILLSAIFLSSILVSYEEIKDLRKFQILSPSLQGQQSAKIRLANGLEALVISDPDTNKAGCVMTVFTGSFSDPEEHPGMAHFLEHMLFLGTKEYPDESEYSHFINDHGGNYNAFTANQETCYMFSIDPEYLDGALSRFSSFFKTPLLSTSQAKKELIAIDQEHSKNVENDGRRNYAVCKSLINPKHPLNRFATGNSSTLCTVSEKELRSFYEKHYKAHLMRLVIIGKEPLDMLKNLAEEKFGLVPTNESERFIPDMPLLNPDYQGKLVVIEPINDIHTLSLIFELPAHFPINETKSDSLITYALSYDGAGSLLEHLKKENLAENLHVHAIKAFGKNAILDISIDLSKEGVQNIEKVLCLTFQAIKKLSLEPVPEHVFNELQTLNQINYQFQDRVDIFEDLYNKGWGLSYEAMDTFPEKSTLLETYDPDEILEIAKSLTFDKAYIHLTTKNYSLQRNKKEKWTGAQFGIHPLPETLVNALTNLELNEEIKLWDDHQNPCLEIDFRQKEREEQFSQTGILPIPKPILDDEGAHILFAQEHRYSELKTFISLFVRDKELDKTIKSTVLADLYMIALNDALSTDLQKLLASFSITRKNFGFQIDIEGFREPCTFLLTKIAGVIEKRELALQRFSIYKERLMAEYQNLALSSPMQMSALLLKASIYKDEQMPEIKEKTLVDITEDDFLQFTEKLFSCGFVEGVIVGNLSSQEAKKIALHAKQVFAKKPLEKPFLKNEVAHLKNAVLQKDIEAQGNSAHLLIESPLPYSLKTMATFEILTKSIEKEFFAELRTKQQTGYIVKASFLEKEHLLLNSFFVQSSTHAPTELLARFEIFIESFLQNLSSHLTKERFATIKNALIFETANPDKNLHTTTSLLYYLLTCHEEDFFLSEKYIEALEKLSYEECVEGIRSILQKSNEKRLAILLQGQPAFEENDLE